MILSQHRLQQQQQNNNNSANGGRISAPTTNIFTVNGAKYIQIGAASSVSLASSNSNNRITNNDNNSHDLKTNTNNKFNPSAIQDRNRQKEAMSNNNRIVTNKSLSIMNGEYYWALGCNVEIYHQEPLDKF